MHYLHRELRTWNWREASRCLQTLEVHLPMRRSKRLKVTNIHFLCFPQAIKLKGIALVHLSPTPGTIFLPSSLLSCLPLSISLLRLMRMLSTGSPVSPLSFSFFSKRHGWNLLVSKMWPNGGKQSAGLREKVLGGRSQRRGHLLRSLWGKGKQIEVWWGYKAEKGADRKSDCGREREAQWKQVK